MPCIDCKQLFWHIIYSVGGFKDFSFHPYLGKWSNLTWIWRAYIFQMDWFNHQLVYHCLFLGIMKHPTALWGGTYMGYLWRIYPFHRRNIARWGNDYSFTFQWDRFPGDLLDCNKSIPKKKDSDRLILTWSNYIIKLNLTLNLLGILNTLYHNYFFKIYII